MSDSEPRVQGVRPATEAVWTHLGADLRRFMRRRVGDEHAADDLVQETLVRVHRNLGSLREGEHLAAWVYQIARNVVHDHYRSSVGAPVALANHDPVEDAGDPAAEGCRGRQWLEEMIGSLSQTYREAVQLAEIEQLPQQEVADRLGLSLSGAKSRIQRGREELKEILEKCCTFEFDRRGNLLNYEPLPDRTVCRKCDE
jgi:RNA polymerase sigma-70 factor, ECF subfamily